MCLNGKNRHATRLFIVGCVLLRCSGPLAGSLTALTSSFLPCQTLCLFTSTAIFSWFLRICGELFGDDRVQLFVYPRCKLTKWTEWWKTLLCGSEDRFSHGQSRLVSSEREFNPLLPFCSTSEMLLLPPVLSGTISSSRGGFFTPSVDP